MKKIDLFLFVTCTLCMILPDQTFAKSATCGVGEFLFSTKCRDCKPGCFCTGGGTKTLSLDPDDKISASVLEAYCRHERNDCPKGSANGGEAYGACGRHNNAKIYRCPDAFPNSSSKATSEEQCYTTVGSKKLYYKKVSCIAGKYLPINSDSCVPCKTGERDYCPGIENVYPSVSTDKGVSSCAPNQKANSTHTACEDNGITCIAGTYLPADSLTCAACPDGYYCKGGTWPQQPIDQGNERCSGSTVPNEKRTACIQGTITVSEGYYLPANATEPVVCKGAKSYCPGGKFDQSPKDQGIFDCPNGGRANKDKTACTITISKNQMSQCWQESGDAENFKSCVLLANSSTNTITYTTTPKYTYKIDTALQKQIREEALDAYKNTGSAYMNVGETLLNPKRY